MDSEITCPKEQANPFQLVCVLCNSVHILGQVNFCIRGVDVLCKPSQGVGDLPLITYAPRGRGGVKSPIHFHCVLHAKSGVEGPDHM